MKELKLTQKPMQTKCIEWNGAISKSGYGSKRFRGKTWLAHRVSWVETNGEIPEGLFVLHHCDNPKCINPDHLFLGTQEDNMHDCFRKGRISKKSRNVGRDQWKAKITEQTAVRIKMMRGIISPQKIAITLGMKHQGIWDIMCNKNWKHVSSKTRYAF